MDFAALYDVPASLITRESFFNIGGHQGFWRWGIYIFVLLVGVYLAYTLINRIMTWRNGQSELRFDQPENSRQRGGIWYRQNHIPEGFPARVRTGKHARASGVVRSGFQHLIHCWQRNGYSIRVEGVNNWILSI